MNQQSAWPTENIEEPCSAASPTLDSFRMPGAAGVSESELSSAVFQWKLALSPEAVSKTNLDCLP